ncbi:hypothetical protein HYS00_05710 [Candidatus Microgenomates bacterium]|nr:hypothetical protein [Candidatus Microgenomates bacterium]
MTDRLLTDRWSMTHIVWALVILIGSLFTYFYPQSIDTVFITWGVLTLAGIGCSSYLADWSNGSNRILQIFWIVTVAVLFATNVLSVSRGFAPQLLKYDIFLQWSVVSSVGYLFTALITRSRPMFVGGLATLFLVPLFSITSLASYSALLFGIPHAAFLLILAF